MPSVCRILQMTLFFFDCWHFLTEIFRHVTQGRQNRYGHFPERLSDWSASVPVFSFRIFRDFLVVFQKFKIKCIYSHILMKKQYLSPLIHYNSILYNRKEFQCVNALVYLENMQMTKNVNLTSTTRGYLWCTVQCHSLKMSLQRKKKKKRTERIDAAPTVKPAIPRCGHN